MAGYVDLSVEAVNESQIQEVTLDGQEIYTQPLSMSENLTKLAHKIDFSKDESEEKGKKTSEGEKEVELEEKNATPFQPSLWPWDSVRNKLKSCYTEMSVLYDILSIVREKHYMVLDPVSLDLPENRATMHMIAKKKAMGLAATLLSSGADKLRKSQETKRSAPDFHLDLLTLRKNWRLKKVGSVILGDLSYKSAGSKYWQNGTFEVMKSEGVDTAVNAAVTQTKSALHVTVPSELEGATYIQVAIKRLTESTDLASAELDLSSAGGAIPTDTHWQRKLEDAQNVIFCKEVFAQLAKEAVQMKSPIPHIVVGNQIFSHLFPGIQLSIALCHYTNKDKKCPMTPPQPEHNHVLEHSLHQLLREVHYRNLYHPMPHPVTGLLGMSKRRRMAGPHAYSRNQLLDMTHSECMLDQIIQQARHIVIRHRAITVIDEIAGRTHDPQIFAHWGCVSSAIEATLKVNITSAGYEAWRTSFILHILVDNIRAVCKDGKVIHMSSEEQELKDFIQVQLAQHHILSVYSLAKMMSWQIISGNNHLGVGDMEWTGTAQGILLASPFGDRVLSIRSGPISGLRVSVQRLPDSDQDHSSSELVKQAKWSLLGGPFHAIHLDKLEGRNFINKIEVLMACLVGEASAGLGASPGVSGGVGAAAGPATGAGAGTGLGTGAAAAVS